jgi:SAM-dependent methyltransferase
MKTIPITSKNNKYLDSPQVTIERSKLLKKKLFLKNTYIDYYLRIYAALSQNNRKGKIVELGSGGGFIKEIIPRVVTSDVLKLPSVDMQFSALKMPFKKQTVNAFVMIDVLHHINDIEKFFQEANRCLKTGGQIIMIEPASTSFGKFIWRNFHHEPYDQTAGWKFKTTGPLSGANGALPWIVFVRDKRIFYKKYPQLKIKKIEAHTPFKYLLSGGFTVRQLVPDFCYPFVKLLEEFCRPFNTQLGIFYTIILKKTE